MLVYAAMSNSKRKENVWGNPDAIRQLLQKLNNKENNISGEYNVVT